MLKVTIALKLRTNDPDVAADEAQRIAVEIQDRVGIVAVSYVEKVGA